MYVSYNTYWVYVRSRREASEAGRAPHCHTRSLVPCPGVRSELTSPYYILYTISSLLSCSVFTHILGCGRYIFLGLPISKHGQGSLSYLSLVLHFGSGLDIFIWFLPHLHLFSIFQPSLTRMQLKYWRSLDKAHMILRMGWGGWRPSLFARSSLSISVLWS